MLICTVAKPNFGKACSHHTEEERRSGGIFTTTAQSWAMIVALAAAENESTHRVTAYRLTRDHRGSSAQRIPGLVGRVSSDPTLSEGVRHPKSSRVVGDIREYEKLVYQTEKIQTTVSDSCEIFIGRSLVPKDLERDLLKIFIPWRTTRAIQRVHPRAGKLQKGRQATRRNMTNLFPWRPTHRSPRSLR